MWTDPIGRGGLAVVVALLLLVGAPAPAQSPEEAPEVPATGPTLGDDELPEGDGEADREEGSYLASSLTLASGRDSGFRAGDEELEDTVHLLRPSLLLLHRPSARTELLLGYEPELQFFDRHSELDAVDHRAGVLYQHEPSRRSRLLAGGSFLDGEDPSRHLGSLLVVLPRVPYQQWRAYAGYEYRWQRTGLLLHVGRTGTRIDPAPGILTPGLDQTEDAVTLTLDRVLDPRTDLVASYSWVDPTYEPPALVEVPDGPGVPDDPDVFHDPDIPHGPDVPHNHTPPDATHLARVSEPYQSASLGLGFQATPRVRLSVTGGVLEQAEDLSYLGSAEVLRSGKALSYRLRYDRSLLSFGPAAAPAGAAPGGPLAPSGALDDTLTQAVTVAFVARPATRFRWEQTLWGAETELPGDETLESFAATSRLVYEVTRRLGAFVQGQHLEQRGSDLLGEPFSRTFVSVGVVVGLTGPRRAWGVREEPASLRRVLPATSERGLR